MTTITVPITTYDDGRKGPDLTGLEGYVSATLDPGGETYTVQMPPGWTPPGRLTRLAFSLRYTQQERIDIRASDDPVVVDSQHLLSLAEYVDVTDPVTIASVEYQEAVGLIAPGRAAEILDPEAP